MLRREAFRLGALASAALLSPAIARAEFYAAPDIVLFCDPALRWPLVAIARSFRRQTTTPIRTIFAAGSIMQAQLLRHERDDIVIAPAATIESLASIGYARPQRQVGVWRNRLVIARHGPGPAAVAPSQLRSLLGGGMLGVPDPDGIAVIDSHALLHRLGLEASLDGRIKGEVDTGGVAWLLEHDQVALGLILASEVRRPDFSASVVIPDAAYPAIRYEVAFARHVLSRQAGAFVDYLATDASRAVLIANGLEIEL